MCCLGLGEFTTLCVALIGFGEDLIAEGFEKGLRGYLSRAHSPSWAVLELSGFSLGVRYLGLGVCGYSFLGSGV